MNKRTFFKLKINISDLDKYPPVNSDPCSLNYLTELIIEGDTIFLKIFYHDKEYFGEKLGYWHSDSEIDILRFFEVIEILEPKELTSIDFSGFESIGSANGSNYYEQFNSNEPPLKYTIVKLNGVRKGFNKFYEEPSEFYLNQTGFPLVELNYEYPMPFPWVKEPYKLEPKNQIEDYIKFDKIEFKTEHNFYNITKYESSLVSIQKEPRLLVKHCELNEEEIRKQVSMLCAIFSFYANNDVDYFVAITNAKNGRFYEKSKKKKIEASGHGIFMWDFNRNPLNLIINVDATHLIKNFEFVMNTIKRFNYATKLTGESKFMILYNVLEQIRVQYILEKKIEQDKAGDPPKLNKVFQEYKFNGENIDTIIKDYLKKICEMVVEDGLQREEFKKEISHKVKNIKLMSMANQFRSLFDYTQINPSICNLDFDRIRRMRNDIFHGAPLKEEDINYLDIINSYDRFPRFVGIMILKYFGIDDLSKIQNKYFGN